MITAPTAIPAIAPVARFLLVVVTGVVSAAAEAELFAVEELELEELELPAADDVVFMVVDAQCVKELLFATTLSFCIVSAVKVLVDA
ncbi:hypothetical protein K438DRAFT_1798443 [Mycena galopus ATCC 62051]|nr:hypothetical protein K438DRAFT_1798443 [Mycena galopus ATCC 62051]